MRTRVWVIVFMALAWLPPVAGGQEQSPDGNVHEWIGQGWMPVNGYGVRISVGPDGQPWVVNSRNEIYRSTSGNFEKMPGEARDIAVGGDGSVWIIGTDSNVYKWNQRDWDRMQGSGVSISAD